MNYRHAFHAGNFADVLKHTVLALVIEHLKRKPAPFRVVDTHAGAGLFALDAEEAEKTGEFRSGIARLLAPSAATLPPDAARLLEPYLAAVRALNPGPGLVAYPGSPCLALALMRPVDRLIASELHPADAEALRTAVAGDRRAKVLEIDGWQALRAVLPPKERRGVVLIDPPFEEPGEFERLASGLADGVRRFATGTYIVWFPVKNGAAVGRMTAMLAAAFPKLLYAELAVRSPDPLGKLAATGLLVLNPPHPLEAQLRTLLPVLSDRLAQGAGSSYRLEWLSAERG